MGDHDHQEDSEEEDSAAPDLGATFQRRDSLATRRRKRKEKVYWQLWHKAGFMLLWVALGLDTIISILGHPILGQSASAICVLMYILNNVSFRRVVCSFWFTVIDLFFRSATDPVVLFRRVIVLPMTLLRPLSVARFVADLDAFLLQGNQRRRRNQA
jgi:hypothetical protein